MRDFVTCFAPKTNTPRMTTLTADLLELLDTDLLQEDSPLPQDSNIHKYEPILPPCEVCGEKSSGYHYGANTCEACKVRDIARTHEESSHGLSLNKTSGPWSYPCVSPALQGYKLKGHDANTMTWPNLCSTDFVTKQQRKTLTLVTAPNPLTTEHQLLRVPCVVFQAFFRRCLKRKQQLFRCEGSEQCEKDLGKSQLANCGFCRYQKCMQLGMSRGGK